MSHEEPIAIRIEADIVTARQRGRALAREIGFSLTDCTLIATAISELTRNVIEYADAGEIRFTRLSDQGKAGIQIVVADRGPGIENLELAMRDGYSTGGSLGMGLPGTKRLMDALDIDSKPGAGTTITMCKWLT